MLLHWIRIPQHTRWLLLNDHSQYSEVRGAIESANLFACRRYGSKHIALMWVSRRSKVKTPTLSDLTLDLDLTRRTVWVSGPQASDRDWSQRDRQSGSLRKNCIFLRSLFEPEICRHASTTCQGTSCHWHTNRPHGDWENIGCHQPLTFRSLQLFLAHSIKPQSLGRRYDSFRV